MHAGVPIFGGGQEDTSEFNNQIKAQIRILTAKIDKILDYFKIDKELYEELDFESKLEAIFDKIKDHFEHVSISPLVKLTFHRRDLIVWETSKIVVILRQN